MLSKIRRLTAVVIFVFVTLLFLDFSGTLHQWFGWLAEIQLIPAILATNFVVIGVLVMITFLFGRVYCSVICPLGIMQDGISHIASKKKGKNRFKYKKMTLTFYLRYGVLLLFIVSILAGLGVVVALLDPYAGYGRIAGNFLNPMYRSTNNLLAWFAERIDSYAFYSVEVWMKSLITFNIAAISLVVIGILAWKNGRTYCNSICPVGTILGFIAKFSLFRLTFDKNKCKKCNACENHCKASCINAKEMNIDHSRCVACFNCIGQCKFGAINYVMANIGTERNVAPVKADNKPTTLNNNSEQLSRRNLLTFVGTLGTLAITKNVNAQPLQLPLHADGGLAEIKDKKIPDRKTSIVPPGALGAQNMKRNCTACQLCISACQNNVLRPSHKLTTLMQPEMSFERGYCRPECIECSSVCPTDAIKPITTADKSAISIGHAVWIKEHCIVNKDNLQCSNCERHCPTNAITLVPRDLSLNDKSENTPKDSSKDAPEDSLKIPAIDKERCIGCGACEHLCPARPFSAIYVEGNLRHHSI
ncbi:MAG: 4Fe-4S dicluster domain-containing protein [Planctomycetaceae bacterium]|jgi:ferredoxin|nr:4Fe-4S dicluster domain-containing protein [Planctomycetaceae bacterium]